MRTRLPAALLLLLSWFLPAAGHAHAAAQVAAVHEAVWQAEQHPGARQTPYQPPSAHARAGSYTAIGGGGGTAVLATGGQRARISWVVVVRRPATGTPVVRLQAATPARAPPSTAL
ncbi:hypothetical protein [Nonomuraea sp. LPB2021202275-12-8]|uniref:hypothetical protein n=1 Tax=Nonomuraea sp. LPB2021202275-12-8 TaxID=3120159 RepID=UPI00300C23A5